METKHTPARRYVICPRCHRENPPEGFYANGYCKPCGAAYYKARRHRDTETYDKIKSQHRAHYARNQEAHIQYEALRNRNAKLEAISHYGGKCECCGEHRIQFLAIDHIDGGGNKQRKQVGPGVVGGKMYYWLRKNNYPSGFRVLCHNCNMSYGMFGYCPHQSPERDFFDVTNRVIRQDRKVNVGLGQGKRHGKSP